MIDAPSWAGVMMPQVDVYRAFYTRELRFHEKKTMREGKRKRDVFKRWGKGASRAG
jgi:hypothetical protein